MGILGSIWPILSSYRPNAAQQRRTDSRAQRFGAFEATYKPPRFGVLRPRSDKEAQALYNHVRTVAFWLDASPLLSDLGLPFRAGLDDIISLVPIYGDIVSGILQLYQVYLAFLFGCPLQLIGWMVLNVLIDIVCGIVPIVGDFLDNLFKSNLRNLALLEEWLLSSEPRPSMFHILLMPETTDFIPSTKKPASGSWFGGGKRSAQAEGRAKDWSRGRVEKTRRMGREEGELWAGRVPPVSSSSAPGPSSSPRVVNEFDLD